MNRIITFLLTLCYLAGCQSAPKSQYEIVKENVEAKIKPKLNDPESYEFVSLTPSDSVSYGDNIEDDRNRYADGLDLSRQEVAQEEGFKRDGYSGYDPKRESDARLEIKKNEKILVVLDSIKRALGKKINDIASYTYIYTFRGKNSFGAKVLNEYIVQTTNGPKFEIINLTNEPDEVYKNPNGYPGEKRVLSIHIDK